MSVTKSFSLLFLFLALVSCGKGGSGNSSEAGQEVELQDISPSKPVPQAAHSFDVNPIMIGFTATQEEKISKAAELIKKVVASNEFKNRILNYTYKGRKAFVDSNFSNAQVYKKILEASEKMTSGGRNNTMDLEIELYNDDTTTIGYTYPRIVRIFMNTKYFNRFNATQVADNMFHEWLHKIGFTHEVDATVSRRHSVPYAIGYMVKSLSKKYM